MMGARPCSAPGGTGHARRSDAGHRRWNRTMQTRRLLSTALVVGALGLAGCADTSSSSTATGDSSAPTTASKGTVRISGQNFTEAEIVADLYAGVLQNAGYQPQVKLVGTRDVYMATFPKSIDVVPEYTG